VVVAAAVVAVAVVALVAWVIPWLFLFDRLLPAFRMGVPTWLCALIAASRTAEKSDELAPSHSITSSAATSMVFGTISASASAVLRLMTITNLVGSTTGRLAGFSPFRILAT